MAAVALVGITAAMREVQEDVRHAARFHGPVLVTGERGSGKETVARAIHQQAGPPGAPFVSVDCARPRIPIGESLLARAATARGATVFLKHVEAMPPPAQERLCRALAKAGDVRLISASTARIDARVGKTFREELFYRLNVIHICVPPLRERRPDVGVLLHHFLQLLARAADAPVPDVTSDALERLTRYDWPGNISELRRLAGSLVRQRIASVTVDVLPAEVRAAADGGAADPQAGPVLPPFQAALERLLEGNSFWSVVYEPFMAHDLTRADVRAIVRLGLRRSAGNYRQLLNDFHMCAGDYERFLHFLRQYGCIVPPPVILRSRGPSAKLRA